MWTKRQAINAANQAVQSYQQQAKDFQKEAQDVENDIQQFREGYENQLKLLAEEMLGSEIQTAHINTLSQKWGCPALETTLNGLKNQRSEKLQQRDTLSTNDTVVNRFDLLESSEASLATRSRNASFDKSTLQQELEPYQAQDFQWLREKEKSRLKVDSVFDTIRKFITMENHKRKKYENALQERFQKNFSQLIPIYDEKTKALEEATLLESQTQADLQKAKEIVAQYDELSQWDSNFPVILQSELSKILSATLKSIALDSLITRVEPTHQQYVAGMHANLKKAEYAEQLVTYLKAEERDRLQRASSISSVERKWRRNPSGSVRGDKSKWLQTVPEMKRQGTRKRIGWSQGMRGSLSGFNNYHYYSYHYHYCCNTNSGFLAYDLFNHYSDCQMPYEGFSSNVIDEISPFRNECSDPSWTSEKPLQETLPNEPTEEHESPEQSEPEEQILEDETISPEEEATAAIAETMDNENFDDSAENDQS